MNRRIVVLELWPLSALAFSGSQSRQWRRGQAVGNLRQRHDVCGPGQQETTWSTVLIDKLLDRQQQSRIALDFVKDDPVKAAEETGGISPCCVEHRSVVERDICPAVLPNLSGKHGLARPPRSHDQNNRGVQMCFPCSMLPEPARTILSPQAGDWESRAWQLEVNFLSIGSHALAGWQPSSPRNRTSMRRRPSRQPSASGKLWH